MSPGKTNKSPSEYPLYDTMDETGIKDILSLLLDNTRDAIYLLAGRRFPIINLAFQDLFGVTSEEANSPDFNFMDLVAPESRPLVIERVEKYSRGEPVPPEYEFHSLTKDGRELIVSTNTSRVRFMGEEATLGIIRDITERKRIEEALTESEEKYRTLVERANDGIAIIQDGKLVFVNERLAHGLGYTVEEMTDTSIADHLLPEHVDKLVDRYKRRMAGEDMPAIYETVTLHKDGSLRQIEVNAGIITFRDRPADLTIARDITDRKAAEKLLQESEAFLESVFESIQDGVSILNPDLTIRHVNGVIREWYADNLPLEGKRCYECYHNATEICDPCPSIRCIETGHTERDIVAGLSGSQVEWLELFSYPIKDGETGKVTGVAEFARDITETKRVQEALQLSEQNLRTMFETMVEGVVWVATDGRFIRANKAAEEILRLKREEETEEREETGMVETRYQTPDWEIFHEDGTPILVEETPWIQAIHSNETVRDAITGIQFPDGVITWLNLTVTPLTDDGGGSTGGIGTFSDITERKRMEQQLLQAQKMEAIGRLAGGIAHDFNNILTVISGNAQLGMMTLKEDDSLYDRLHTILKSSGHAEELTRRLLAFGRKQITSPRVLDVNEILSELEHMLRRIIGEDLNLTIRPGHNLGAVTFDPTQIEQILVNLVVNARDAMPEGGSLTIETAEVELGVDYTRLHPYVETGRYIRISVVDTGTGMSEETMRHVFEPFFTTKDAGSGLGLATVYGIVKQAGGSIEVKSSEGVGTTFKIYLPVVDLPAEQIDVRKVKPEFQQGSETILLVEDETGVRSFAVEILTELGYTVHDFSSPEKAWDFCESNDRDIDLILTDVIMPGASGVELVERLQIQYPSATALFMSGHTDDFIVHHGVLDEDVHFLPKPFSPQELSEKVRNILDAPKGE